MTVLSGLYNSTPYLPPKVIDVPRDLIRAFQHSKKVGNYLLGRTLGEGSFAKVKEALHIPTGEKVAIKVVDKRRAREDSYVRKNLRREGKLLQQIRHPNIIQLYEVMETENSYYLVTELCKGGDLMDYIYQRKKLEEREVKRFVRQIISAIDYLHRQGILHRDLKVENLLLNENNDIKLIDFGLGNNVRVAHTKDGIRAQELLITQCGSPAYAAPELLGRKKYGPKVDIWSIGINMYAMLTGTLPFTVDPFNIKLLYNKMITGQMNPLPDYVSKDCRDLLRKLLIPEPEKRINLSDAMKHPWIAECKTKPMEPFPCPNKLRNDELVENIVKYMSEVQGFRMSEVIRFVTSNIPSAALTMYQILHRKLVAHMADLRVKGKIPAFETQMIEQIRQTTNGNWVSNRQKATVVFSSSQNKDKFASSPCKGKIQEQKVEKDVTITDIDDDNDTGMFQESPQTIIEQKPSKYKSTSRPCLRQRQSLPKSSLLTKEIPAHKQSSKQSIHTTNAARSKSVLGEEVFTVNIGRSSSTSPCRVLKSPRRVVLKSKPFIHTKDPSQKLKDGESVEKVTSVITQNTKFQKIENNATKVTCGSVELLKRSDAKVVVNKRLINLAYIPNKTTTQRRTLSLGSNEDDIESIVERKELSVSNCKSLQRPIEALTDLASKEEITTFSSLSKNTSSQATSRSDRSDSRMALPCISQTLHSKQN